MTSEQDHKALVFLMGTDDMRRLFDEWPSKMQLAVCLQDDGDCRMLVYREEEGARFLPRLRRALSLPLNQICFFPEIDGYPSRKILYSEEKQILALVRGSAEIVEEAADYSINYTFALDEGLDPIRFLTASQAPKPAPKKQVGARPKPTDQTPIQHPKPKRPPPVENAAPKQEPAPVAEANLPRFMQRTTASEPGPAFQSLDQIKARNPLPKTCTIHREADGWIGIDLPGCLGGQVAISNPGRIFVRDDRRVIAIHSDLIGRDGSPLPGQINLGIKYLPDGIRDILQSSVGEAKLSFDKGFLFIALKPEAKRGSPAPSDPKRLKRLSAYWRLWATAAVGVSVMMVGLQLMQSAPTSINEADTKIDWSQFQSGALDGQTSGLRVALNQIGG